MLAARYPTFQRQPLVRNPMTDRVICGWRVRSKLPLPETAPWRGLHRAVDITIDPGRLPTPAGKAAGDLPFIETGPDGGLLINAMPVARFLVTPNSVIVDFSHSAGASDWRALLLSPVLGALCYFRGFLPLHASALRIEGRTVAIAGASCAGKSTLAAALIRRGHAFVTDDICAMMWSAQGASVLPSFPALRLAHDSMRILGMDPTRFPRVMRDVEKFVVPANVGYDPAPSRLAAVYLIEDAEEEAGRDSIVPLEGAAAFARLCGILYRPMFWRLLFKQSVLFEMTVRLSQDLRMFRLIRRPHLTQLDMLARMIETDAGSKEIIFKTLNPRGPFSPHREAEI